MRALLLMLIVAVAMPAYAGRSSESGGVRLRGSAAKAQTEKKQPRTAKKVKRTAKSTPKSKSKSKPKAKKSSSDTFAKRPMP